MVPRARPASRGRGPGAAPLITAMLAGGVLVAGCGGSHGAPAAETTQTTQTTQTRTVAPFTAVDLAGAAVLTVRVGDARSVVVHGEADVVAQVTTEVRGGALVVGSSGSVHASTVLSVAITLPDLTGVTLSGSGTVTVTGVQGPSLRSRLSGTGVLRISGRTDRLDATLAGAGDEDLSGLTARTAAAGLLGAGRLVVTVTQALSATLNGSGTIVYFGEPGSVAKSVTGAGSIVSG